MMNTLNNNKKIKHQSGLTLVELMVAMVIGLVLTGGVIQIFVANNQTYRVTDNMSRLQENGRFALDILSKTIRLAGFKDNDNTANLTAPFTVTAPFTDIEQFVSGTDGVIGGGPGGLDSPDDLFIRFRGASLVSMADCIGTGIGQGSASSGLIVVNRFYLNGTTLTCQSWLNGVVQVPQPLIDNVVSMQILYGMTDNPASNSPNCYIPAPPASTIGVGTDCTTLNFNQVVSVRIKLLLTTQDDNLTSGGAAQTLTFDDNGAADTMVDRRLYRTMTQTISLRNKNL